MKRMIRASQMVRVPDAVSNIYHIADDAEVADITGYTPDPDELYPCEEIEGYDATHIAWLVANPEFEDELIKDGYDVVELVSEGGHIFVGYVANDRLYNITDEVADKINEDYEYEDY